MKPIALMLGVALSLTTLNGSLIAKSAGPAAASPPQTEQASAALKEGRRLLKRGRSDQALIQLQNALKLYTAAKKQSGIAASHNELGDLYLRQGQYTVALDHYQKALDGFLAGDPSKQAVNAAVGLGDDKFNANLMLAKIGDVNFRLGKISEALSAYGRMVVTKPESSASRFGPKMPGLSSIMGGGRPSAPSVSTPTDAMSLALEAKKELDNYRNAIVYSSYELGLGRIAFATNDLRLGRKTLPERTFCIGQRHRGPRQTRTDAPFSCCCAYEPG